MIYHVPVLSQPDLGLFRAPGPGLGNLLFPIARAIIGQRCIGGGLVLPTMRQIKVGTVLRWERDRRVYGDIFKHRNANELGSWLRAKMLPAVRENEASGQPHGAILYQGMANQFHDLAGYSDIIAQFLKKRSRIPIRCERYDVAMHVRLGDFGAAETGAANKNARIPLEWYRNALAVARERLGQQKVRGVLFTDESPTRVIEALKLEGFIPEPYGNALTAMMALANANVLIGSRSTFSLWGRYLGNGSAIWPSGFDIQRYAPIEKNRDIFV